MTYLRDALRSVNSIDEFQEKVMNEAVGWCIDNTIHNFSYDGISYIKGIRGKFLAMSNHRDIILDPAITQMVFFRNGIPLTEICVGDNLIKQSKTVEYLLRSNRMIKVIRGISARDLYLSSQMLSKYIRQTITSGKASIWLAQRQGRTKVHQCYFQERLPMNELYKAYKKAVRSASASISICSLLSDAVPSTSLPTACGVRKCLTPEGLCIRQGENSYTVLGIPVQSEIQQ